MPNTRRWRSRKALDSPLKISFVAPSPRPLEEAVARLAAATINRAVAERDTGDLIPSSRLRALVADVRPTASSSSVDDSGLHTLYRFFTADNKVLYIGITCDPGRRFTEHGVGKSWWASVVRIELQHHASRKALLDAERRAIWVERPVYNVVFNRAAK